MKQLAQLMAMIYVDSVEDARSFYVDKLGFTHMMGMLGKDGLLDFCTVSLDGARIMLMRPSEGIKGTNATTEKRPVERRGGLSRTGQEAEDKAGYTVNQPVVGRPDFHSSRPVWLSNLVLSERRRA